MAPLRVLPRATRREARVARANPRGIQLLGLAEVVRPEAISSRGRGRRGVLQRARRERSREELRVRRGACDACDARHACDACGVRDARACVTSNKACDAWTAAKSCKPDQDVAR